MKKLVFTQQPGRRGQGIQNGIIGSGGNVLRKVIIIISLAVSLFNGSAQNIFEDNARKEYFLAKDDTSRVISLSDMGYYWRYTNMDSAIYYARNGLSLAEKINYPHGEAYVLSILGTIFREKGDYPAALQHELRSKEIAEKYDYLQDESNALRRIGMVYMDLKYYDKSLEYYKEALNIDLQIGNKKGEGYEYLISS